MAEAVVDENAVAKNQQWCELIADHARSGVSVRKFCKERGIAEHLFFYWRKRLRGQKEPVRFALIERGAAPADSTATAALELVLTSGERLRISAGVDASTLRTVLQALRA